MVNLSLRFEQGAQLLWPRISTFGRGKTCAKQQLIFGLAGPSEGPKRRVQDNERVVDSSPMVTQQLSVRITPFYRLDLLILRRHTICRRRPDRRTISIIATLSGGRYGARRQRKVDRPCGERLLTHHTGGCDKGVHIPLFIERWIRLCTLCRYKTGTRLFTLTVDVGNRRQDDELHQPFHARVTLGDQQDASHARKVLIPRRLRRKEAPSDVKSGGRR